MDPSAVRSRFPGFRPGPLRAVLVSLLLGWSATGRTASAGDVRVVEITARRFEFSPAEVKLRRDEPVILRLTSLDVTHGFFQRALGIDVDIEAGKVTDVAVTPRTPGRYLAICDHFCGSGHGNMKMTFVVE
jgi:cytochrome c oxidase subunit 2